MQIHRWKRKERWDELARAVAPAVQKEVVEHAAYSVAEIKVQHSNEARSLRQRIMQMLDGFPIKTLVTSDGKPVHVYGHPSPGDIRLLVGAYKEVSDLELERLGEEPVNGRFDLRFPEFASLLEDIWSSRRKEVPVAERRGMTTPSDRVRLGLLEPAREQPRPLVTPP